jgi:hypothetical protein
MSIKTRRREHLILAALAWRYVAGYHSERAKARAFSIHAKDWIFRSP